MTKSKKTSDTAFIEGLYQKFSDIADTIPADQWGFNTEVFELLREKRHEIINKFPPKIVKSMSKKDMVKLGREYGPKCNTVTEIIEWISSTHLAKIGGVPKKPQNLKAKNNGIVKEKNAEEIAKASKEKRQNQKESRKKNNTKKQQPKKSKGKIQKKKETVKKVIKKVKPAKKKNRGGIPTAASA